MIMLLATQPNIREIIAFPMNQQTKDLLMQAPGEADPAHLKELGRTPQPPRPVGA